MMRRSVLAGSVLVLAAVPLWGQGQEAPKQEAPKLDPRRVRPVVLANNRVSLKYTGLGLEQVRRLAPRMDCLVGEEPSPFFAVWVKALGPGKPRVVTSRDCTLEAFTQEGARRLSARWSTQEGALQITCSVSLGEDDLARHTLEVVNRSAEEVCAAESPVLRGVRIGVDTGDDTLVMPGVWGQVWRNPSASKRAPQRAMAMRWVDVADGAGGLYVASHDPQQLDTVVETPGKAGNSVDIVFRREVRVAPGRSWTSGETVVGPHSGDWHWGADRYREWAATWRRPLTRPGWVRECDGWKAVTWAPFSDLPLELERARAQGFDYLQTWGEMTELESDCGTFPLPSPLLGTIPELQDALAEIRDQGGHTTFYLNSQLWEPGHSDRPRIGSVPKSLIPTEVPIPTRGWYEQNAPREFGQPAAKGDGQLLMCAGATGWQQHLRFWADQYRRFYGADGLYLDQMGCTNSACAVLDHGHAGYGAWQASHTRNLRTMVQENRARTGSFIAAIEGCNDAVGQFADFQLASGVLHQGELYRYTFPEDIVIDGYSNGGVRPDFGGEERGFGRVFLLGARFDGLPDTELGRRLMALRKQTKQLLYRARYRDTVGVTVQLPRGVEVVEHTPKGLEGALPDREFDARLFTIEEPETRVALVNVLNTQKIEGAKITVATGSVGVIRSAFVFDGTGISALRFTQDAGLVTFVAPLAPHATVLLVRQCEPLVYPSAPRNLAPGERGELKVRVLNLDPEPAQGTIYVKAPAGWGAATLALEPLKTGEQVEVSLPLAVQVGVRPGPAEVRVMASAQQGTGTRYLEVPVVAALTAQLEQVGDEVRATFRNRSGQAQAFQATLKPGEGLSVENETRAVQLAPGATHVERWPVIGLGSRRLPAHAVLETSVGLSRRLAVRPTVLNGGFETTGGNDIATYWHVYHPAERGKTHLDSSTAAEGSQSLRLDPLNVPGRYVMTAFTRLQPDTTYRLRASVRRSELSPEIWVGVFGYPRESFLAAAGRMGKDKEPGFKVGEWQAFETTFRTRAGAPRDSWYAVYCYNWSPTATAWFDDVRIEAVGK